jgi:hypothetical protein
MAGNFTPIYGCEGSLPIQEICTTYGPGPTRARRRKSDGCVTHPGEFVLEELKPSGPVQEAIGQFVAARQLLGHPVAVSRWNVTKEVLLRRI